MLAPEVAVMPLTGLALALLAVAAVTGWLDGPLQRLRLRPAAAAMACLVLLASPGRLWTLSLAPLAPWLAVGVRPALSLDPGAYLLPLVLLAVLAVRDSRRRTLVAVAVVGTGLLACFLWLPGEPAQVALLDPALLYAVAGGLAASLAAGSTAGAAAAGGFGYAIAEAGRALSALYSGDPVLVLGGDPGRPLLLAVLVGLAAGELVYGARPAEARPRLLRRP